MNIVVYTAIAGEYDAKMPAHASQSRVNEAYLFSDCYSPRSGWLSVDLEFLGKELRSDLVNRYHKFFPHRLPFEADISIYVDGNIELKKDLGLLIDEFVESGMVFGCFKHPQRVNLQQELEACKLLKKFKGNDDEMAVRQLDCYRREGFPDDYPLQAATVLFRRHGDMARLDEAMSLWWDQINQFTARDQLSLPYVLWKTDLPYMSFDLDIFNNEYFLRHPHLGAQSTQAQIKSKARKLVRYFIKELRLK